MKNEDIEKAAENYGWKIKKNTFSDPVKANDLANSAKQDFIAGANYMTERMYSEKDIRQFAFECVVKFLSNEENKIEMKLVDVIIDRINQQFETFKKK